MQVVELRGFVMTIAGRGIDVTGLQEADRLVVAQRLDRDAAAAAELADLQHHAEDRSVSSYRLVG